MARLGLRRQQLKLRVRKMRLRRTLARLKHVVVPEDPARAFAIAFRAVEEAVKEELTDDPIQERLHMLKAYFAPTSTEQRPLPSNASRQSRP